MPIRGNGCSSLAWAAPKPDLRGRGRNSASHTSRIAPLERWQRVRERHERQSVKTALTGFASYLRLILNFLSRFRVFLFFWLLPILREGVFADLLDLAEGVAEESDARVLAGS